MNILQMISKNDRYGAQRIFLDQVAALHAGGHRVIVAVRGTEGFVTDSVRSMGVPWYGIPMKGPRDIWFLCRLVRNNNIDIIHTTLDRADYLGLVLSRITGRPAVSTMMVPRSLPGYRFIHHVVTLVNKQAFILEQKGIPRHRVSVIRPGIDVRRFSHPDQDKKKHWYKKLSIENFSLIFCHVSSLHARKAHMVSFELVSECRKRGERPLLVIIGDPVQGEYYETLVARSRAMGIKDCIYFTGWTADVSEILSLSHFTVLPSENEALGVVLMEGMAAGTPVIAREGEGSAELINEFGSGFLYSPKEGVPQLAGRIIALKQNQKSYRDLSEKCRKIAEEEFSLSRFGQALENTYRNILKREGRG